jgi:hypothetical protein
MHLQTTVKIIHDPNNPTLDGTVVQEGANGKEGAPPVFTPASSTQQPGTRIDFHQSSTEGYVREYSAGSCKVKIHGQAGEGSTKVTFHGNDLPANVRLPSRETGVMIHDAPSPPVLPQQSAADQESIAMAKKEGEAILARLSPSENGNGNGEISSKSQATLELAMAALEEIKKLREDFRSATSLFDHVGKLEVITEETAIHEAATDQ